MSSPIESDNPNDVCCSCVRSNTEDGSEFWHSSTCVFFNINKSDSSVRAPINIKEMEEFSEFDSSLEGAVGGSFSRLPDLCDTGVCSELPLSFEEEIVEADSSCEASPNLEFNDNSRHGGGNLFKHENVDSKQNLQFSLVADIEKSIESPHLEPNGFLNLRKQKINILECATGILFSSNEKSRSAKNIEKMDNLGGSYSDWPCKVPVRNEFEMIRGNMYNSSDPLFNSWDCSAYISGDLLLPILFCSHGTTLANDYVFPFIIKSSRVSSTRDSHQQLTEEDKIKLAKRQGLIQHLPQGIFNGSTTTRECVICMIEFSDGEQLRYLPCMHTYHAECIDDWLMRSFTCPSCLEPVDAALLSTYQTS